MSINDKTRIIGDPGKFEGEPVYVRELWDSVMDGCEDDTIYDGDTPVSVFFVDAAMRTDYDLDESDHSILLWEDSNGFVHSRVMSEADFCSFHAECSSDEEETD